MSNTIQFGNNIELSKSNKAMRKQRMTAYVRKHRHVRGIRRQAEK